MRSVPLLAAILVALVPSAGAAENGLSLSGPGSIHTDGPTSVPLRVALTLENVVCTSAAEIPVRLAIARAQGAAASLPWDRVVFRIAAHSAAAGAWHADSQASVIVEPDDASGLVDVVARYDLPSQCVAPGGERAGEAHHVVRFDADATPQGAGSTGHAVKTVPPYRAEHESIPAPVQGAILGTCAGGLVVLVKRWRARAV